MTLLEVQRQRLSERESRLFMHYMVSDVSEVEIDRTSRVLVPRKLREHAGIGEDVILVGMYDRLEVWGSQVWLSHLSELEEEHEMSLSKVLSMPSIKPSFPGVEAAPMSIQVSQVKGDIVELIFNPREEDLRVGETLRIQERDSGGRAHRTDCGFPYGDLPFPHSRTTRTSSWERGPCPVARDVDVSGRIACIRRTNSKPVKRAI